MTDTNEDAVRQSLDAASQGVPEGNKSWPELDRELVRLVRPLAPKISSEDLDLIFGDWAEWITDAAEAKACPVDYVAWPLLTVAAATIGNARWASPWEEWEEPPVLWVMLVGDPSSNKRPAMDAVLGEVGLIDAEFAKDFSEKRSSWEEKAEIAKAAYSVWMQQSKAALSEGNDALPKPNAAKTPPQPVQRRIRIIDATTEKIAEILQQTWRGLLQSRDELSDWLSSMDRYGGGGDREFWLEGFGGRTFAVDRKSNPEPLIVAHLSICILGSTQPEKLDQLLLQSVDDGLLSRFLIVFPDPVPLMKPTRRPNREFLRIGLRRLLALEPGANDDGTPAPVVVKFEDDAQDLLQGFREDCRASELIAEGKMKSHLGKLPGLVVRVALVLAHLDYAADDFAAVVDRISEDHVRRAIVLVGQITKGHAERALASSAVPKERLSANKIGSWIIRERLTQISTSDIMRKGWAGLGSAKEVDPAISVLIDADWVAPKRQSNKGRPHKQYVVNPKLFSGEQ